MRRSAIAALIGGLILASPALSATGAAQQVLPEAPPPPYEDQLLRLSEILGAVHYLRHLCLADEKDTWRQQMELLLEAEQPDDQRRRRMVDRFNRGYESFRSVYRTCTTAATESADRYLQEGAKISAEITARYGR